MRIFLIVSILSLSLFAVACGSSGNRNPPARSATTADDNPPGVVEADLACKTDEDCVEFIVWSWNEAARGYCTGCDTKAMNRDGARRHAEWYRAREGGRSCPMHDCEPVTQRSACVQGQCTSVPIVRDNPESPTQ